MSLRTSLLFLPLLACDAGSDDARSLDCDDLRAQYAGLPGHALTIDDDGRMFVVDGTTIARLDPDGVLDTEWVTLDAIADDVAWTSGRLYATDRAAGTIVVLDPAGPAGQAPQVVVEEAATYGLAGSADGALFFTRADHTIARLGPAGVVLSDVATEPLPAAIGDLAIAPDGALLAIEMFGGDVYRLELDDAHREVSRTLLARTDVPFAQGLAVDDDGRLHYVAGGIVYRRSPPYRDEDVQILSAGLTSAAKVAVGRGACRRDVYVSGTPGVAIAGE